MKRAARERGGRARARRAVVGGTLGVVFAGTLVAASNIGCESSSSLPYTPYTGIDFAPATLLAGVGCGTSGRQAYRYAVIVGDPVDAGQPSLAPLPDGAPSAVASVFSCDTLGVFESLPTAPNGGPTAEAWVYVYDEADFDDAAAVVPDLACGTATCALTLADAQLLMQLPSTYATTCMATPESSDNVLASCQPLLVVQAPDGGTRDATTSDVPAEAAPAEAAPAQADAAKQ